MIFGANNKISLFFPSSLLITWRMYIPPGSKNGSWEKRINAWPGGLGLWLFQLAKPSRSDKTAIGFHRRWRESEIVFRWRNLWVVGRCRWLWFHDLSGPEPTAPENNPRTASLFNRIKMYCKILYPGQQSVRVIYRESPNPRSPYSASSYIVFSFSNRFSFTSFLFFFIFFTELSIFSHIFFYYMWIFFCHENKFRERLSVLVFTCSIRQCATGSKMPTKNKKKTTI